MERFDRISQALHVFLEAGLNDYGRTVTADRILIYVEGLSHLTDAQLDRGLGQVIQTMENFPMVADIIRLSRPEVGEPVERKNANCPRCEGTGWRYADPDNTRAGVKPCDCRPAPKELASPKTPVDGLPHELAGEIAAAAAGRSM